MNISIILAHPNPGSFNHAIADAAADALRRNGHQVVSHDLYHEHFPALLTAAELHKDAVLDAIVARHCAEIVAADGIIIVHPNWWGMPPAILVGWIDRVLRPDVAYRFVDGDSGEGTPVGLLRARAALVLNTSNTFPDREARVFGDPLERIWKDCIFGLCGVARLERRIFGPIVTSTSMARRAWLQEARETMARLFPQEG